MARVRDGYLVATIGGDIVMRFSRVTGKSVFPPVAVLPSLAQADEPTPREPLVTEDSAVGG